MFQQLVRIFPAWF